MPNYLELDIPLERKPSCGTCNLVTPGGLKDMAKDSVANFRRIQFSVEIFYHPRRLSPLTSRPMYIESGAADLSGDHPK